MGFAVEAWAGVDWSVMVGNFVIIEIKDIAVETA